MTVTDVRKDTDAATMQITTEYAATTDQVWRLWDDPRLLERWWGPPTYPATVVQHDLTAGGTIRYFMTSPEGERYHGLWEVRDVEPAKLLVVDDKFADEDGTVNTELPTTAMQVTIAEREGGGTTMTILSTFASTEAMAKVLEMGMEEGIRQALGQTDALLADAA